ncbi:biotin carboxylase [Modicisalibacter xianhensis]|uniref:Biotin carboxylase n=1 Tax=Modicisalibacter xianhensis TaxID=442341 RepID=A0A4R8FKX7_9GAMM|nr:ATP-grasp domain-containing protein [Halomonas xianhensis]TDX26926.1 biotin carboxylase [Halomonas xianhensis]
MKTILFLGASSTQVPPIVYAVEQGHHVLTCDNRPDNPGHRLAHESFDISTTDKETVLALAASRNIDGIVAYASDPAAPTAAFVAERLGLPGNPYESVLTLSQKDRFREFLQRNGFNAPRSRSFHAQAEAQEWLDQLDFPVYVKPIDSSGGKGITILADRERFADAFAHAMNFSHEKKVVVEEKIHGNVGYQNDSDVFMVNGKLRFWIWGDSHFNHACSPPFQAASSYPGSLETRLEKKVCQELERLLGLLNFRSGAFNVEFLIDANDEIWFLEVGARNGGGGTVDAIKFATGVDMAKYTVDVALGGDCSSLKNRKASGYWAECLVHSLVSGELEGLEFSDELAGKIFQKTIWTNPGDLIYKATGSNHALGMMILKFESREEMNRILDDISSHIFVKVRSDMIVGQEAATLPA